MASINVFQQKFPLKNCRGFTMYDSADAPAIVINKSEDLDVAKIFTLIHEYCHLLLRKPGISDENSTNPVESYCNKFAAAFLIPTDAVRLLLPQWPNKPIAWDNDQIANLAARLKVSRMALALRLEELGVAPDGFHKKFKIRHSQPELRQGTLGRHRSRNPRAARRMRDIPEIHVEVISSRAKPTGVGQMATPLVAPAVCNAFAELTGVRLRHTPMTPDRVLASLAVVTERGAG